MSEQGDEDRFMATLAAMREAWQLTREQLDALTSPLRQFNEATSLAEELRSMSGEAAIRRAVAAARLQDAGLSLAEIGGVLGNISKQRAGELAKKGQDVIRALAAAGAAGEEDYMTGPSTAPEPEPVVAAIVISDLGVLIARRNDGKPPWTFIAGKIEPGESPADAAVREVKEETGLRIRAGGVIGRRVHPRTGRTMVYMAARPTHGTEVTVGDPEELAEVRWVSFEEADSLTGGTIFEPVRQHLRHMLGNGNGGE
jgi:8-oxo-dGTP diphosphatase